MSWPALNRSYKTLEPEGCTILDILIYDTSPIQVCAREPLNQNVINDGSGIRQKYLGIWCTKSILNKKVVVDGNLLFGDTLSLETLVGWASGMFHSED